MDQAQWNEYRDKTIKRVTDQIDRMKPVAEAMDVDEASFEGKFTLHGDGIFTVGTRVANVPLFDESVDPEPDTGDV